MAMHLQTYSDMRTFALCTEKYRLRSVLGFEPHERALPLEFGSAAHAGVEAYWRARKARAARPADVMLATLPAGFDPYEAARLRVMLTAYGAVWDHTAARVLGVEVPFTMPLVNPHTGERSVFWMRAGKIDLILQARDGRIVLVEHKTSSQEVGPGTHYNRRLRLDEQLSYYFDGAESLGYRPDQILYDVLRKPTQDPYKATPVEDRKYVKDRKTKEMRLSARQRERDETPEEFEKRVGDAVLGRVDHFIHRPVIHRFKPERDRFAFDVWNRSELMRHAIENGFFARNSDQCFAYQRPCPYLEVCEGAEDIAKSPRFRKIEDVHPELEGFGREQMAS